MFQFQRLMLILMYLSTWPNQLKIKKLQNQKKRKLESNICRMILNLENTLRCTKALVILYESQQYIICSFILYFCKKLFLRFKSHDNDFTSYVFSTLNSKGQENYPSLLVCYVVLEYFSDIHLILELKMQHKIVRESIELWI